MTIELPVSKVDTIGLPKPPVVAVDANLVTLELPATVAAVPPPARIANPKLLLDLNLLR